jgi:hypothetical protein
MDLVRKQLMRYKHREPKVRRLKSPHAGDRITGEDWTADLVLPKGNGEHRLLTDFELSRILNGDSD